MKTQSEVFSKDGLVISITKTEALVTLTWEGISDAREPDLVLGPLMRRLAAELKGRPVTMDFHRFEYMNSATVSLIVQLIKLLDGQGVLITLIYDTQVSWQRINYQCMKAIARSLNHLQVKAA